MSFGATPTTGPDDCGRWLPLVSGRMGRFVPTARNTQVATTWIRLALLTFTDSGWRCWRGGGADLLACETIPSAAEARALVSLLDGLEGGSAGRGRVDQLHLQG